ncbi:MAG: type IV pili twitching motility protein PilT [Rickettsiales bacterium]|nr:type IV pili twitching motility protein PilT [Rickettsiales bacterium]
MFDKLNPLLEQMVQHKASDLYLTYGCPASIRLSDRIMTVDNAPLTEEQVRTYMEELLDEEQLDEFETTLEYNSAINWMDRARFRINAFRQQQHTALVIRRIQTEIPTIEELGLPEAYRNLVMERRGLVLVVGPTGSGKSTSLAAMIGHRNRNGSGHIITIEDPVEFVHTHQGCIISQRDVGIDTYSFGMALKNALRQRPDVVLIGEVRDRETMEHAINFSETGHLVLATLHANNANQAIERALNFFPEEKHHQILLNLSLNLKGVLSQRLVLNKKQGRSLAVEVLLNSGLIKTLIEEGKIRDIKEMMEKSRDAGMQTFDQSLFDLYAQGLVDQDVAIAEADNPANLRLNIRQATTGRTLQSATTPSAPSDSDSFKI